MPEKVKENIPQHSYEDSLKYYRDMQNSLDTAKGEGRAEGRAEGKIEMAIKLLQLGISVQDIADASGLSILEIEKLKK